MSGAWNDAALSKWHKGGCACCMSGGQEAIALSPEDEYRHVQRTQLIIRKHLALTGEAGEHAESPYEPRVVRSARRPPEVLEQRCALRMREAGWVGHHQLLELPPGASATGPQRNSADERQAGQTKCERQRPAEAHGVDDRECVHALLCEL